MPPKNLKTRKIRSEISRSPKSPDAQLLIKQTQQGLYTVEQAAEYLELQPNTIRKYCQYSCFSNVLAIGKRRWLIAVEDLNWWRDNRQGLIGRPPEMS